MSRTLQQLRTDLTSLQSGLKELHSLLKISPDAIKVPSWRYPEKMATNVRVQAKECEDTQLLLELLVDRFVLVLQSCVLEMDHTNGGTSGGSSPGSVPLSLSSAMRRFTQGFTQKTSQYKELNKSVEELKSQLTTLQSTVTTYSDIIINQLGPSALPQNTDIRNNQFSLTTNRTVSTQTIQTSLAAIEKIQPLASSCQQCPKHIEGKAVMSKAINTLKRELTQHFNEDSNDTSTEVDNSSLDSDLAIIKECFTSCEKQRTSLKEELVSKDSQITELKDQYSQVMNDVTKLQEEIQNNQKKYKEEIALHQTNNEISLNELKGELGQVSSVADNLQKEVVSLKKIEAQLKCTISQKKEETLVLQSSFKSSLKDKESLQKTRRELNEYILALKKDYKAISQELDDKCLQLNKTSTQLSNMESRCKYLQSKQMKLLSQVDEMDQNCTHLNELLSQAVREKEEVKGKLTEMTEKCSQTLEELQKEKLLLEQSHKDHETIRLECTQLQEVIKMTQKQLNEEKGRTHLLMEYPYRSTVDSSISHVQSRQHIDANCVRILLLEEQNLELRQLHDAQLNNNTSPQRVLEPIRLWDNIPKSTHVYRTVSSKERLHIGSASSYNSDTNSDHT